MSLEIIAVNQPYPYPLPPVEGAISDFLRPSSNRLLIAIHDITKEEEAILGKGELRCGMLAKNGALLFIWQFRDARGNPVFTLDCPFDARLVADIQLYDISHSEERISVDVHVVDLSTKLVRCLRSITMPPGLTIEFLSVVQDQLASQQSGNELLASWMSRELDDLCKQTQMWLMGT